MLDWAKRWIGPVIWDDSHHPGAYNPVLSHGRTEAEEEARLERERERQVQLEKERRRGETYLGRVQNQVGKWVGSAVAGATAGIGGFRKAAAPGGGSNEGAGSYFRRPRKPAYGEYISAEVVAELQKVRTPRGTFPLSVVGIQELTSRTWTGSQHRPLCVQATLCRHSRSVHLVAPSLPHTRAHPASSCPTQIPAPRITTATTSRPLWSCLRPRIRTASRSSSRTGGGSGTGRRRSQDEAHSSSKRNAMQKVQILAAAGGLARWAVRVATR